MMAKLAVLIPTRGTLMARTLTSVLENLAVANLPYRFVVCEGFPIPKSFEYLIEEGIRTGSDYLWLVEDDMDIPKGGLETMIVEMTRQRLDVITAHTPMVTGKCNLVFGKDGEFLYGGTACVLIKTEALSHLPRPFFSIEYAFEKRDGILFKRQVPPKEWGGQDVYFWRNCVDGGLKVGVSSLVCRHLQLEERGEQLSNHGLDEISVLSLPDQHPHGKSQAPSHPSSNHPQEQKSSGSPREPRPTGRRELLRIS